MKIRVLLVDSRKIFREGICALLERHPDIKIVGEADEGPAAVKLVKALAPDIVILNLALSTQHSRELIQSLRTASADTRVIALTVSPNTSFLRDILAAGISGCLTKECAAADLVTAISTVMTHKVYLSPKIAEAVVSGYVLPGAGKAGKPVTLSVREKQILQRIADGQSTKQIAAAFSVSNKTIETHRRRMMQKLGKHSVAELTKYAVSEGISSLELQT